MIYSKTDSELCFQTAIPDKFSLGKDKARYMIIYGIYPAFKQKLKVVTDVSPCYSVSFDESLNKNQQKCQMDVNLRYWNDKRIQYNIYIYIYIYIYIPFYDKQAPGLHTIQY